MSGWKTRDPADVGLGPSDYTDGQSPAFDAATGKFVPADASTTGWTLVESASQPDFDAATDTGAVLAVYRWGVDTSGNPYFDADGAAAGEEAALWIDNSGDYVLVDLEL